MNFSERPLIFVDAEMTGLDPSIHEMIELAAIKLNPNTLEIVACLDLKIEPLSLETADPIAMSINGYTPELWRSANSLLAAMLAFQSFSAECVLNSQSITHDYAFISEAYRRTKLHDEAERHRLDLPTIAWWVFPGIDSVRLSDLSKRLGIVAEPIPHRAMYGARQALSVFRAIYTQMALGSRLLGLAPYSRTQGGHKPSAEFSF